MKMSWLFGSGMLTIMILTGCGGGSQIPPPAEQNRNAAQRTDSPAGVAHPEDDAQDSSVVPASGIAKSPKKADSTETDAELNLTPPEKDSPEWFLFQITRLKLRPLGDPHDAETQTAEKQAEFRRERNERIVELATESIARTHKDKSKARVFDLAVHHLLEAELQLALTGDQNHTDALYEHASSLYERDPQSKAAIEAGQTLISFARLNAQRFGQQDPKWLEEYSRLVRQFAKNFPQEERLAIPMLFAVGQSCEFHGLNAEAIQCYATIREQFPENAAVERVTPILRRLNLKGQPLQLAGPTIGGRYLNAEELTGKPLLVVFWTTQAQPFVRQLATLKELLGQIDPGRLNVVSVNLDDDDNEAAVQTFLETNGLNWPTIFQSEPDQRGWNNPVATYYGIQSVPLYWVVSAKGNVVETASDVTRIESLLRRLMTSKKASETEQK